MSFLNPTPPAVGVYYDNNVSGLSSEDVNSAIDELASSSVSPFPLEYIGALVSVFVPVNRQYHVYQNLTVDGNLTLDGRLVIFG